MRTRYLVILTLLLALGLRVGVVASTTFKPKNDARSYLQLASQIANAGDYSDRDLGAGNSRGPTAYFPPGYPYFLAAIDVLDGHHTPAGGAQEPARLGQAVLGTVVVGLIGLVALELFGGTIALIALAVAALYPPLIELSSVLVAETLLVAFELGAVWAVLRARRSGRPYAWYAGAGVLSGLAALTHDNGFLVAIPLAFAAWRAPRSLAPPALLVGAAILTLAPWTIRDAVVLHHFVPISDEAGITLAGTYNPTSASDAQIPYRWTYFGDIPSDAAIKRQALRLSEPELSSRLEARALGYIGAHPLAPVAAAFDNTLRLLELAGSFAWEASTSSVGLGRGLAEIGVLGFWALGALAIVGGFTREARGAPAWLWAVPILLWLSVVFVNAETPRFREPIDPFLILLSACGLNALARRALSRAKRSASPVSAPDVGAD